MNNNNKFNYILILIIIIFLLFTILSIRNVKAQIDLSPIKVAINSGDDYKTIVGPNEELLNGYN